MKLLCEYLDNIIKHVILGMNKDSKILRNFSILAWKWGQVDVKGNKLQRHMSEMSDIANSKSYIN